MFQDRLRKIRIAAGYKTAKDFAKELRIPYPTYMAYENKNREPSYEMLMHIADTLGVTLDQLVGYAPKWADRQWDVTMTISLRIAAPTMDKAQRIAEMQVKEIPQLIDSETDDVWLVTDDEG